MLSVTGISGVWTGFAADHSKAACSGGKAR